MREQNDLFMILIESAGWREAFETFRQTGIWTQELQETYTNTEEALRVIEAHGDWGDKMRALAEAKETGVIPFETFYAFLTALAEKNTQTRVLEDSAIKEVADTIEVSPTETTIVEKSLDRWNYQQKYQREVRYLLSEHFNQESVKNHLRIMLESIISQDATKEEVASEINAFSAITDDANKLAAYISQWLSAEDLHIVINQLRREENEELREQQRVLRKGKRHRGPRGRGYQERADEGSEVIIKMYERFLKQPPRAFAEELEKRLRHYREKLRRNKEPHYLNIPIDKELYDECALLALSSVLLELTDEEKEQFNLNSSKRVKNLLDALALNQLEGVVKQQMQEKESARVQWLLRNKAKKKWLNLVNAWNESQKHVITKDIEKNMFEILCTWKKTFHVAEDVWENIEMLFPPATISYKAEQKAEPLKQSLASAFWDAKKKIKMAKK